MVWLPCCLALAGWHRGGCVVPVCVRRRAAGCAVGWREAPVPCDPLLRITPAELLSLRTWSPGASVGLRRHKQRPRWSYPRRIFVVSSSHPLRIRCVRCPRPFRTADPLGASAEKTGGKWQRDTGSTLWSSVKEVARMMIDTSRGITDVARECGVHDMRLGKCAWGTVTTAPAISQMCGLLWVSKSGFYEWRSNQGSAAAARGREEISAGPTRRFGSVGLRA